MTTEWGEEFSHTTVPLSDLSHTMDNFASIYERCAPTFIDLKGNPLVERHTDSQGTYFTVWYEPESEDTDESGDTEDLGTIRYVDADEYYQTTKGARFVRYDPLVLDLDGDGIETISHESNAGANFDLLEENGLFGQHGWIGQDDGLLAHDENSNGVIDGISELFGDAQTSGFSKLSQHDGNGDGVINLEDAIFSDLIVWRDQNSDGISQTEEMITLEHLGIASISVSGSAVSETNNGNSVTQTGSFQYADGTVHVVADVNFTVDVASLQAHDEFVFA